MGQSDTRLEIPVDVYTICIRRSLSLARRVYPHIRLLRSNLSSSSLSYGVSSCLSHAQLFGCNINTSNVQYSFKYYVFIA